MSAPKPEAPAPPAAFVRVTLTVEVPFAEERNGNMKSAQLAVIKALRQEGKLPDGSELTGYIDLRALTAKDREKANKRAAKRDKERYG